MSDSPTDYLPADLIFHEKQQGLLCAQHCLNTLLQSEMFTAVELAEIAKNLDEDEARRFAEGGETSEEYRKFKEKGSQNMDDSGYFSIQVLQQALKVWNLDMIPFNSKDEYALELQQNPTDASAYICNHRDHWYTIRKFHRFWFNLNSCNSKPSPISDTYLSLFLKQLQVEGQSVFIIKGSLPDCAADQFFVANPDFKFNYNTPRIHGKLSASLEKNLNNFEDDDNEEEKRNLKEIMEMSQREADKKDTEREQSEIELAIAMSLRDQPGSSDGGSLY